jgi:hypothetical protein
MRGAVIQTEEVKVDVTTIDGKPMSPQAATLPVGSALRIAPAFRAQSDDEHSGVRVTLEAAYLESEGRYVIREMAARALREDIRESSLRRTPTQEVLQSAVPQCITLQIAGEGDGAPWTPVSELAATAGRIIPAPLAAEAALRGAKELRMDVIEIIYGTAALAGLPPIKAVQRELGVPHRTAGDWIRAARAAGRLKGMNYHVGRQADGID